MRWVSVLVLVLALAASSCGDGPSAAVSSSRTSGSSTAPDVIPGPTGATALPPAWGPLERTPILDVLGIGDLATIGATTELTSGFESPSDLAGGYVTPQSDAGLGGAPRRRGGDGPYGPARAGSLRLYAPPSFLAGTVYNDDLTIWSFGRRK